MISAKTCPICAFLLNESIDRVSARGCLWGWSLKTEIATGDLSCFNYVTEMLGMSTTPRNIY